MKLNELIQGLAELRRNPAQNPKISIAKQMRADLRDRSPLEGTEFLNRWLHMSDILKLGINPRASYGSEHDPKLATPLAIYAFPAEYGLKVTGDQEDLWDLPYGGDRKYAHVFSYGGPQGFPAVLDLQDIERDEAEELLEQMGVPKKFWDPVPGMGAGGLLWSASRRWAFDQAPPRTSGTQNPQDRTVAPAAVQWTGLLRSAGIRMVIDRRGIVFPDEPLQMLFFDLGDLSDHQILLNRYSERKQQKSRREGEIRSSQPGRAHNSNIPRWREVIARGQAEEIADAAPGPWNPRSLKVYAALLRDKDRSLALRVAAHQPSITGYIPNLQGKDLVELIRDHAEDAQNQRQVIKNFAERNPSSAVNVINQAVILAAAQLGSATGSRDRYLLGEFLAMITRSWRGADTASQWPGLSRRAREAAESALEPRKVKSD
jgi:hypothetical protein